ncbi:hypothetical protein SAMN05216456_1458 [Devosia crocina]|uniref:Uncharacterized protein n=2 Tax=Devosia crocina TaxID=429728 RepID=A0A1I7NAS9_9HYPH|nr:hypothetical protein SAMN05216456_1458 [Devosia crocina]
MITAGMARSGIIREENWRTGSVNQIAVDSECAAAIAKYLALLPVRLEDTDQLMRQSETLAPADTKTVLHAIRVQAANAGVPFTISEIP